MRALRGPAAAIVLALLWPALASAHPERIAAFEFPVTGHVPVYRTTGPSNVVCKANSGKLLRKEFRGQKKLLRQRLATLNRCRFADIQAAINKAQSGYRILIMPGTYTEQPSRHVPVGAPGQPPCANDYVTVEEGTGPPPGGPRSNDKPDRANRNYVIKCPNSKNLIAVVGDTRPEPTPKTPTPPICVQLCNLQIEGMGKHPQNVRIVGDRQKLDVLRIDRANGAYLRNFEIEQGAFNDVDLIEVDGFVVKDVIARYAQNYGILSFTATHGLYDHDTAYGNGDSGLYPGSTMKGCATDGAINPNTYGTCEKPGCGNPSIEIRNSNSYDNTLGYSGTAGNSTYVHDNRFHDNATGLATDSFASGHPGMPQECFHWDNNQIYSNNRNVFAAARQTYCKNTPFALRKPTIVCPQFQTAVGSGILIGGGSRDLLTKNWIYDNWRDGVFLLSVPATLRGDNDPTHQEDTSDQNRFIDNTMGTTPAGKRMPNGLEFLWDSAGQGNCFEGNKMQSPSDPTSLPACPGSAVYMPADPSVLGAAAPCTAWDPNNDPEPVGCDWFTTPAKPK
ncbi:MAG: Right handed beta helix region [Solirubrobacteraceae bacterium]|nr:Right handed beta helix region [Solirubrobacteraceae bacterium]